MNIEIIINKFLITLEDIYYNSKDVDLLKEIKREIIYFKKIKNQNFNNYSIVNNAFLNIRNSCIIDSKKKVKNLIHLYKQNKDYFSQKIILKINIFIDNLFFLIN